MKAQRPGDRAPLEGGIQQMTTVLSVWDRALGLTDHASARMQQRGVTAPMIGIALEYGERAWSHGAVCWRLTERCLCGTPHEGESDHLRGLCAVVGRDGALITAKWDYRL